MKTLFKTLFLGVLIFSFSCKETTDQSTTEESLVEATVAELAVSSEQTKAVSQHHLEAFGANDSAGVVSDYAAEAVVVTPDSTLQV